MVSLSPVPVSCTCSPNLQGLSLEQILQMDPVEGGPLDQNPLPHLVTKRWVYDQYHSCWRGDEGSSPNWLARVLLRFPEQAQNALIKLSWLERAKRRAAEQPVIDDDSGPLVAGCGRRRVVDCRLRLRV